MTIAAVSCYSGGPRLGGVGLGSGTTGKLGRAWIGVWVVHGMVHGVVYGVVPCAWYGVWCLVMLIAPSHARPSLPVIPEPNPAPPNLDPQEVHDTAALL